VSKLKTVTLENTKETLTAHSESVCRGEVCCIHNRTDHCMRGFPQHWRSDRGIMERTCEHGVGHPDPDDWMNTDTIHGCCMGPCCGPIPSSGTLADGTTWTVKYVKTIEPIGDFHSELEVAVGWDEGKDPHQKIAELTDALEKALKRETEKKREIRRLNSIMEGMKALMDRKL
jgi:hypothetical protein